MHQEVSIIENANFFQVDIQVVDRELKVRFAYFTLNLVYTKPYWLCQFLIGKVGKTQVIY
jgi:hypothetical protein